MIKLGRWGVRMVTPSTYLSLVLFAMLLSLILELHRLKNSTDFRPRLKTDLEDRQD